MCVHVENQYWAAVLKIVPYMLLTDTCYLNAVGQAERGRCSIVHNRDIKKKTFPKILCTMELAIKKLLSGFCPQSYTPNYT